MAGDMDLILDGHRIKFSHMEHCFFMALFNARGMPVSENEVHNAIYGRCKFPDGKPYRVYAQRLREVLAPTEFRVNTIYGYGWSLQRLPEVIPVSEMP